MTADRISAAAQKEIKQLEKEKKQARLKLEKIKRKHCNQMGLQMLNKRVNAPSHAPVLCTT